jgi:hypothetical protein
MAMKHLQGAIEMDAHRKHGASGIDFEIDTISVKDAATTGSTLVSFTFTTTAAGDAETLLEVFAVPEMWKNTLNSFQARELWKEVVTELAVKCIIPVENLLLENIKTHVAVMQTLTLEHPDAFKPADENVELAAEIKDLLVANVPNNCAGCADPEILLASDLWSSNVAKGTGSSGSQSSAPAPSGVSGNGDTTSSDQVEYPYLVMTTAIVASLGAIVFISLTAGFGKRCLKPLPKEHHDHHGSGVGGEAGVTSAEPAEDTQVDTILLHNGKDKFWVLWKGYQRHKIVPKALQGKDRVQLPTVETRASLGARDGKAIAVFEEILEIDEDDLEECHHESEDWAEFEDCLLEAEHEHGMRPKIYAYPHFVNRDLSFARAAAFRKRYAQMTEGRTSATSKAPITGLGRLARLKGQAGRKKFNLDKVPAMEL